jgi:hypothetical protein
MHGTSLAMHLSVTSPKYRLHVRALQQMLMDALVRWSYLFHNARMTESYGFEVEPLPVLISRTWVRGLGKEPN